MESRPTSPGWLPTANIDDIEGTVTIGNAYGERSLNNEELFTRLYEANASLLVALAVRKFSVPLDDAEALAHEVFLKYLEAPGEIKDLHHWLVAAICNASRHYWRQHGRNIDALDIEKAESSKKTTS